MYSNDDFSPRCNTGDDILDKLFGERGETGGECACEHSDGCGTGAGEHSWGLKGYPHAMVYSVLQDFDELYELEAALERGTLFKKLDLPFLGYSENNSCGICRTSCGGTRNG